MQQMITVLDFDDLYDREEFYQSAPHQRINLREVPGTNGYCEDTAAETIRERIRAGKPSHIYFLGSGNYHYVSFLLQKEICRDFTLVLFDCHTDLQKPLFPELLSCGCWVRRAMDEMEQRVRNLKEKEDFDAIRPDLDGNEIMDLLGLEPGPMVGRAYKHMLEYRLEPEGGLLVCALGTLEVGGGQIVECSLCLSDILPERRVALAVERVAEDFFLPSPTGQGMPLTREELRQRLEERAPSVFFSSELCAHYFTYMSRQNGAHFVLFDDAGSIRKKLQVARNLGISSAVLAYPQVDDLLPELLK